MTTSSPDKSNQTRTNTQQFAAFVSGSSSRKRASPSASSRSEEVAEDVEVEVEEGHNTRAHYPKRARTGVSSADEKQQRCSSSMNERPRRRILTVET